MTRFRPSVESLDARTLPSAVFATAEYADAALCAAPAPTADDCGDTAVEKVILRDFNFTAKVSKPSPK